MTVWERHRNFLSNIEALAKQTNELAKGLNAENMIATERVIEDRMAQQDKFLKGFNENEKNGKKSIKKLFNIRLCFRRVIFYWVYHCSCIWLTHSNVRSN